MSEKLLEVKNLKKYFKQPSGYLHAVDDVSFSINTGETLGVVGESGCGKSTLGRVILHLLDCNDGEILYKGENITRISRSKLGMLRKEMQIIFQDPYSSLDPRKTVYQTISEPIEIKKLYAGEKLRHRVFELMETVGLSRRYVNTYPHELDGGRRQRIGIARALALNPNFIVCDEPVSALDVSIQAQILNLLMDIQEQMGLTFLFITHDLSVVKHISNSVIVMYLGQIVEQASSDEIFNEQLHPYTKALLSAIPIPKVRKQKERILLKGEITSPINPSPGCRFAARCNFMKPECLESEPELYEFKKDHYVKCFYANDLNK